MASRKGWFSVTRVAACEGHVSTGSAESRHLQAARTECRSVLGRRRYPGAARLRSDVEAEHRDADPDQQKADKLDRPQRLFVQEEAKQEDEAGRQILAKRSEEHTSELKSLMRISYAVFC